MPPGVFRESGVSLSGSSSSSVSGRCGVAIFQQCVRSFVGHARTYYRGDTGAVGVTAEWPVAALAAPLPVRGEA